MSGQFEQAVKAAKLREERLLADMHELKLEAEARTRDAQAARTQAQQQSERAARLDPGSDSRADDGRPADPASCQVAATALVDDLVWWATALRTARQADAVGAGAW